MGRRLAAGLEPAQELDGVISRTVFEKKTARTITTPAAFRRELARVRMTGFAIDKVPDLAFDGDDVVLLCQDYASERAQVFRSTDGGATWPSSPTRLFDSVSISLNAWDDASYSGICRPSVPGAWESLLAFVRLAVSAGPRVRLTAVAWEGVEMGRVRAVAEGLGLPLVTRGGA